MGKFNIKGKVVFENIGTGVWGVVDKDGNEWRPVNMPEKLKKKGLSVDLAVEDAGEDVSIFMWGKPVKIAGK